MLRIPRLHAIGQPKPPKGHSWAGAVDVVIGRFSQPFSESPSRQRVKIKKQYLRPYKEWDKWDNCPHLLQNEVFV